MLLILTFYLVLCLNLSNYGKAEQLNFDANETVGEFINKKIEIITNKTIELIENDIILFKDPVILSCHKAQGSKIYILKELDGFLFMLSVNELLATEVNNKNQAALHLMGTISKFENDTILDVQIEKWRNMLILIVQHSSMLNIFLAKYEFNSAHEINSIQKIEIPSQIDEFKLFRKGDDLHLVIYHINKNVANELMFFTWQNSFFSKDFVDSVDVPNKSNLHVFNENLEDTLLLSIGYGNENQSTKVVVFKQTEDSTKRWMKLQGMHFKQDYVEHFVVHRKLYLIGCSTDAFCGIYKWSGTQFQRQLKISYHVLETIKSISSNYDLIIVENFHNQLSFYSSSDIIDVKPGAVLPKTADVFKNLIYKSSRNKLFYTEVKLNESSIAISFREVELIKNSNERVSDVINDPIECVKSLKMTLKSRLSKVKSSEKNAQKLKTSEKNLQMDHKKFLYSHEAHLKNSIVNRVKIPFKVGIKAKNLLQQVINNNIQVGTVSQDLSQLPTTQERAEENVMIELESLNVKNLVYNGKQQLFNNVLKKSTSPYKLTSQIKLNTLTANNLVVLSNLINNISLDTLLNTTRTKSVSGLKIFRSLKTNSLDIDNHLNNASLAFLSANDSKLVPTDKIDFQGEINIKHLRVKFLNNFNTQSLFDNIYQKQRDDAVHGDIIIQNSVNVKSLVANKILSVPINNLLTTSTDQTINSQVFISKFFANKIDAETINNENIGKNIAMIDEDNEITVPTQFMNINILENLSIDEQNEEHSKSASLIEKLKRHVIGTDKSDLSQFYNGKVVIKGSLTVTSLSAFLPKTKIIVDSKEVPQNIEENYWMKSINQQLKVANFKIDTSQIKTRSAITKQLNGHATTDFISTKSNEKIQGPVSARFENAIVEGNVISHRKNHPSFLFQLSKIAIPRDGPPTEILSTIEFRNQLLVKNLHATLINNLPLHTLVNKNQPVIEFIAPKTVKHLEALQTHVDGVMSFSNYNNINLQKFRNNAIWIDKPIILDSLTISSFHSSNLSVNKFENRNFNEMISSLQNEFDAESAKGKRNLRIHGDVHFKANIFIDTINTETPCNEFFSILVMKKEPSQEIGGEKIFQQGLVVSESLHSKLLNGISVERLLRQSLSRGDKQTIKNPLFLKNLKVNVLHTNMLNDIYFTELIDKEKLHLPLNINLNLKRLVVEDLTSLSPTVDIKQMIQIATFPKRINWNYIDVERDTSLPFSNETFLDFLIKYGVRKSVPGEIYANTRIVNTQKLYMRNVIKQFDTIINTRTTSLDIYKLLLDSVQNHSPQEEVISGRKLVLKGQRFDANDLKINRQCTFYTTHVNDVNVTELNQTIHRLNDYISSVKSFQQLYVKDLIVNDGTVNGINPAALVYSSMPNLVLPALKAQYLEVANLVTYTFNSYSLKYFLENRLRKYGNDRQKMETPITIRSAHFENDCKLTSINNIYIDDAVYKTTDQLQDITAHKIVNGDITILGPAHVYTINGIDLAEFAKKTVSRHQDYNAAYLQLPKVELKNGMHVSRNINGFNIDELLLSDTHSPKLNDLVSLIASLNKQITQIDQVKGAKKSNKRMLYIDIDESIDFQFKTPRSNDENDDWVNQNEIEFKQYSKGVVVSKRSNEVMMVDLQSVNLKLNANFENEELGSKTIEIFWSYVENPEVKYFQNLSFTNSIVDTKFVESANGVVIMVLALKNKVLSTTEVAFLHLDRKEHDWKVLQHTIEGLCENTKMAIIEATNNQQYLVISTFNATKDEVIILKYESTLSNFVENQKKLVGGNFDIILGMNVNPKSFALKSMTFLLLAKTGGKEITIYRLKDQSTEFVFQRMMDEFKDKIVEVLVLYINNTPFFIVSQKTGLFCLYEWRGIESWHSKYCGKFENIRRMKSFEYLNRQHLFLASTIRKTGSSVNALAIYRQGEF